MITADLVDTALLAYLEGAIDVPGRLYAAPPGSPALYWKLERPPGTTFDGSLGIPEQGLLYRARLRAVARSTDAEKAGRSAARLGGELAARMLDRTAPITGDGWEVSGRILLADAGVDGEGQLANHVADYELLISPASAAP